MKNYYEILEVNRKASKEIIDKAYKVLIKKYHPDLFEGEKQQYAEKKTKELNEAYNVLSNQFLKEQYDVELEKQEERQKIKKQSETDKKEETQNQENNDEEKQVKRPKVGTLESIVELTKRLIDLIKNREKREEIKEVTRKDVIALLLTIVVVAIIGVALWFIPFTNGWMRELLFENPLFSWIGALFS